MSNPQIIITLAPSGHLIAELPGANGTRRPVPITSLSTIRVILEAQLRFETEIGLDGAPTGRQVLHWERHFEWADPQCPFCKAEGRLTTRPQGRHPVGSRDEVKLGNGVTVRRVKSKSKTPKPRQVRLMDNPNGLLPLVAPKGQRTRKETQYTSLALDDLLS